MTKITKLHELLLTHMDKSARKGYVQKPDVDQAEAAINEYIADIRKRDEAWFNAKIAEIIGDDEPTELLEVTDTLTMGRREKVLHSKINELRNILRAEQRQRAGITGSGK